MTARLGDPARHFFMTRSVARVMGISLTEAMQSGALSQAGYAAMVTTCRGCAHLEACEEWLSSRTNEATSAPPGCCNAHVLNDLRAALPERPCA